MDKLIEDSELGFGDTSLTRTLLFKLFKSFVGVDKLNAYYNSLPESNDAGEFCKSVIQSISLDLRYNGQNLVETIPASGPLAIVSNFPHGFVDMVALLYSVLQVRSDVKIVTSPLFQRITPLADHILPFDLSRSGSLASFQHSYREAKDYLTRGGVLIIFPALRVTAVGRNSKKVESIAWNPKIVKFLYTVSTPILPLFIYGRNSVNYRFYELISPKIAELSLGKEFLNKRNYPLALVSGKVLSRNIISSTADFSELTSLLKANIRLLRRKFEQESRMEVDFLLKERFQAARYKQSFFNDDLISLISKSFLTSKRTVSKAAVHLLDKDDYQIYLFDIQPYPALANRFSPLLIPQESIEDFDDEEDASQKKSKKLKKQKRNLLPILSHDEIEVLAHSSLVVAFNSSTFSISAVMSLGLGDLIVSKIGLEGFQSFKIFEPRKNLNKILPSSVELGKVIYSTQTRGKARLQDLLITAVYSKFMPLNGYVALFSVTRLCSSDSRIAKQLLLNYLENQPFSSFQKRGERFALPRRAADELRVPLFEPSVSHVLGNRDIVSNFIDDIDPDFGTLPYDFSLLVNRGAKLVSIGYTEPQGKKQVAGFMMLKRD